MSSDSVPRPMRCRAAARITASEFATLVGLHRRLDPVLQDLACELAGHDGSHVAFVAAAAGGDQWLWLRWDAERRELIQIDPCTAEQPFASCPDSCLLPDRHAGPHSFETWLR